MVIDNGLLDNELVNQKNAIIRMIQEGRLSEAESCLNFVSPLWKAAGYDYKRVELKQRLAREILAGCE